MKTVEQWLHTAVEELDNLVFEGELDLLKHPFQIYYGRVKGKKGGETVQPSDAEDISLADFFPTTIGISYEVGNTEQIVTNLAYECVKAFFNVSKGKRFKKILEKFNFEEPYTSPNPSPYLKDLIKETIKNVEKREGDFPWKAVKFPVKKSAGEKKPTKAVFFCPECGLEYTVPLNKLKNIEGTPTCICGTKCGRDNETPDKN